MITIKIAGQPMYIYSYWPIWPVYTLIGITIWHPKEGSITYCLASIQGRTGPAGETGDRGRTGKPGTTVSDNYPRMFHAIKGTLSGMMKNSGLHADQLCTCTLLERNAIGMCWKSYA